ncbi:bifunctional RNase H/acid phosphatase [Natronosporangium hydrolyticum]|uniref:Bifunctional RNase H/acid phosphatase n=1 Tax=Natronosporangium hydrolyticum TaxID=2811111 RepID=A0A895Y6C5_9ACTN|nr:bifunctional RNase H/acid phosphatase [Natronosporangium hydrolyticum]QSB13284.1 bifunctional RNase H/acid phosphatase [Natronosporangium hydrolyticum]
MSRRVIVEADGGARGNPGPAGWGTVVRDAETGDVLAERSEAIGIATNNVAEYRGVIAGLAAAAELGAETVEARMDSKLVVEQMTGRWRIKNPGLRPLAAEAAALVRRFDNVDWRWVPRERNRDADRLANQAMDAAARGDTGPPAAAAASGPPEAAAPRLRGAWEAPDTAPLRLLLTRHGETELNLQHRYSGRHDVALTDRGQAQAQALAARIAQSLPQLDAVVSSPLQRCTGTAEAIAAATGDPPVTVDPDLIECDFGDWEGRTFQEVRDEWPDQLDAWHRSPAVAAPGGESLDQVDTRVRRAVVALRQAYPEGGTVAVVSHVWPVKLMLRDALGAGDTFLQRLLLAAAGLSVVDTYPDGTVAVHVINDTSHLDSPEWSTR